jgi:putative tricarboxylic transport membrane protein
MPRLALLAFAFLPAAAPSQELPFDRLLIVAPAAPGGGWDQTARVLAAALREEGIARVVEVENVPGAAGTIGLARFASAHRGEGDALLVTGLVMMSAIVMNDSPVSLAEVTPIARLTGEYEVVVVPKASPFRSLADLMAALRRNPGSVSFAGGSAGGTDELLLGILAREASIDPAATNYIAFSGGGESLAALLGNQVAAGISGLSEYAPHIESGSLRALAVSSPDPLPGVDIPTLRQQGFDLELANWRGLVAPPGLHGAAKEALVSAIDRLVRTPAWQQALERNGWVDLHLSGDAFAGFLGSEQKRITAVVRDLGGTSIASAAGEMAFPAIVGVGLLLSSGILLARPSGEKGPPGNRRALGFLGMGALADVILLEPAGFVIASTVLFWCAARGFGSRRWARDAILGLAFSASAYVLFTRALSLSLPAGRFLP